MDEHETQRDFPSSDLLWGLLPQVDSQSHSRAPLLKQSAHQDAGLMHLYLADSGWLPGGVLLMALSSFD